MPDRLMFSDGTVQFGAGTQVVSYTEFNTDVSITNTSEATADTVVTAPALTPLAGDSYMIEFFAPGVQPGSTLGAQVLIVLYDNGLPIVPGLSIIAQYINVAAQAYVTGCYAKRRVTPSLVSHTYSIRAFRVTTNGVVRGSGGSTNAPGFVMISRL